MLAMAMEGCDAVLLAGVSTGLYAGPHKPRVLADFETIVNELLGERIAHNQFGSAPAALGSALRRWSGLSSDEDVGLFYVQHCLRLQLRYMFMLASFLEHVKLLKLKTS